jgi:hypothetical protein
MPRQAISVERVVCHRGAVVAVLAVLAVLAVSGLAPLLILNSSAASLFTYYFLPITLCCLLSCSAVPLFSFLSLNS